MFILRTMFNKNIVKINEIIIPAVLVAMLIYNALVDEFNAFCLVSDIMLSIDCFVKLLLTCT